MHAPDFVGAARGLLRHCLAWTEDPEASIELRLYARNLILTCSLNMPIWFGLPVGVAKSLRKSFQTFFRSTGLRSPELRNRLICAASFKGVRWTGR